MPVADDDEGPFLVLYDEYYTETMDILYEALNDHAVASEPSVRRHLVEEIAALCAQLTPEQLGWADEDQLRERGLCIADTMKWNARPAPPRSIPDEHQMRTDDLLEALHMRAGLTSDDHRRQADELVASIVAELPPAAVAWAKQAFADAP